MTARGSSGKNLSSAEPRAVHGAWARQFKVYRTMARVLLSYGSFNLKKKFHSEGWAEKTLSAVNRRNAERILDAILAVRGLFIKVGQLMGVLAGFLPTEFKDSLEGLQDSVPPRPWDEIRRRLVEELGEAPEVLFAEISPEALAAASLAQVHRGVLPDGRCVAIKVQYESIERLARLDLATVQRIIRISGFFTGLRGLDAVFDEVQKMIHDELDFRQEAENIRLIGKNLEPRPQQEGLVVIPELSTSRVLVTGFVDALKISDLAALDARNIDRQDLAERLLQAYCRMIFEDGVFHADPHPGNLLVKDDGTLVFIDFGAVGHLTGRLREGIPKFLEAVLRRDREEILRTLRQMGFIQRHPDEDVTQAVIDYFYSRFLDDLEFEAWNLKDVRLDLAMKLEMMADFRHLDLAMRDLTAVFQVPREWILLARTLALLLGVCTQLDPEMRPVATFQPFLKEFVLGKERDWLSLVRSAVTDLTLAAMTLPGDFKRILKKAEKGEIAYEVRGLRESSQLLYALGHQLLFGASAMASGALAYFALQNGGGALANALTGVSAVSILIVATSWWRARRWQRALRRRP